MFASFEGSWFVPMWRQRFVTQASSSHAVVHVPCLRQVRFDPGAQVRPARIGAERGFEVAGSNGAKLVEAVLDAFIEKLPGPRLSGQAGRNGTRGTPEQRPVIGVLTEFLAQRQHAGPVFRAQQVSGPGPQPGKAFSVHGGNLT